MSRFGRSVGAALLALAAVAVPSSLWATPPNLILSAEYVEPTRRYPHGVLGDDVEWGALKIEVDMCSGCENTLIKTFTLRLPEHRVFEDTAPRVVDVHGDGFPSVVVVESDATQGARLAIYDAGGLVAATPFIGTRNRWLAPIGIADLDGDGMIELAYIDRPHLAKTLRVWRFDAETSTLTEVAQARGLTNHRIGEHDIAGGIRTCGEAPEMIVTTADWSRLIAATLSSGQLALRDIGPHQDRTSFASALRCE